MGEIYISADDPNLRGKHGERVIKILCEFGGNIQKQMGNFRAGVVDEGDSGIAQKLRTVAAACRGSNGIK